MPSSVAPSSALIPPSTMLDTLRHFLQVYWLRPENAFWMTLRSAALARCPLESPSLDLCCGDGLFSFLHSGGKLDPSFDVFSTVGQLDQVTHEHADMFDVMPEHYHPSIISQPSQSIDMGVDLKPALLAKARALSFYRRLTQHDANTLMAIEDDAYQWVYCNAAYWIERIDLFLRELTRITRHEGRIVLQVKLACMQGYTLGAFEHQLGGRFLEIIGRGRMDTWPTLANQGQWEQRFMQAGLHVEDCRPLVTRTHAQIWDVGLRPIAPLLVKMANGLESSSRTSIKKDWVELFCDLLTPLCDPGLDLFTPSSEPAELQYVLRPV